MSLMTMLLIGVMSLSFAACSDSNSSGGQPEITGVKILSSDTLNYSYDSYYTKAGPGTMLAVMGKNLGGALHVFINDQEVTFNTTMNTDNSLIVTVPTETNGFKLSAFDSTIPDEIRVVTGGGTATYAFKITAPGPQIQRIQAAYPREAGDLLVLYGLNLVDIEKIYITDEQAARLDTTTWEEVPGTHYDITDYYDIEKDHHLNVTTNSYETTSVLGAIAPAQVPDSGAIVVECSAGITYFAFYKRPGKPTITSISSDMPQIGEDLVIKGTEFVQVESVQYGDITLTDADFTVSAEENQITIPFTRKPTDGSAATLTVTTPGGTVSVDRFYDYSTILTTFDGDATDNGWGPNASYEDSGTADGIFAHFDIPTEYQQWWGTMIYFRKDWSGNSFALSPNIPATATADEVYFAMNVYNNYSDYQNGVFTGYVRYMIQPLGDSENQYDIPFEWIEYPTAISFSETVLGDIDGNAPVGQWYRHVVPLSKFACYAGKSYSEIVTTGLNQFRVQSINQGTGAGKIDVKFDNARVIYIPSK
ncbi:MAG: hypothetical protein IJ527_07720 [Prevotella sp.]|nr:hypothetical protein [Prevotella sp.]